MFDAEVTYSTGSNSFPYSVTTADVNGDNKPDVIVTNAGAHNVGVFLNTGTGTFDAQVTYSTGSFSSPWSVTAADVNGDSKPDVIATNVGVHKVGVLFNTGTGTFNDPVIYSTGSASQPYSVTTADVNGDSKPDIIVANSGTQTVGVFLKNGTDTFNDPVIFSTGPISGPRSVTAADVNGDDKPDIIVANYAAHNIGVFLNTGAGTFNVQVTYSTGPDSYPNSVTTADVNGDNKPDIIVANSAASNTGVFLNDGTGTFNDQVTYFTGSPSQPISVTTADVNGDNKPDIIVANRFGYNIGVFLNTGTGEFSAQVNYFAGSNFHPISVTTADVNGDSKPDIIVSNNIGNNIHVFLNLCQ